MKAGWGFVKVRSAQEFCVGLGGGTPAPKRLVLPLEGFQVLAPKRELLPVGAFVGGAPALKRLVDCVGWVWVAFPPKMEELAAGALGFAVLAPKRPGPCEGWFCVVLLPKRPGPCEGWFCVVLLPKPVYDDGFVPAVLPKLEFILHFCLVYVIAWTGGIVVLDVI